MGKDNIPFHTIIWPAMLMGYGGLNLPYDVPANEFLNLEGFQFSTSRNRAVWLPDYLDRYEPDPLRYVISVTMPETSDSDFSWSEYVRRNNDELVATYGNLVHRVLTMAYRNFDGKVPPHGDIDASSQALLDEAGRALDEAAGHLEACRFRAALESSMSVARSANAYLDQKSPWRAIRTDRGRRRIRPLDVPGGDRLPQDRSLPIPAIQLEQAPRHARLRRRGRTARLVVVG